MKKSSTDDSSDTDSEAMVRYGDSGNHSQAKKLQSDDNMFEGGTSDDESSTDSAVDDDDSSFELPEKEQHAAEKELNHQEQHAAKIANARLSLKATESEEAGNDEEATEESDFLKTEASDPLLK